MIDLARFTRQEYNEVVPIVNDVFIIRGRKFIISPIEDGWYRVTFGDIIGDWKKATPLEIEKKIKTLKSFVGYPVGDEVIPMNFDNFYKRGKSETVSVHFQNALPWDIIRFVEWEDGQYYFAGSDPKANRTVMRQVKKAYEDNKGIDDIKGVTPEVRYVFLLHRMQRDAFLAIQEMEKLKLAEEERQKRIEEFRSTFPGRLEKTIEDAGGKLVRFNKRGSNYNVVWTVGGQRITSTIKDDFGILELGYCASGEDKRHSLSSAIKLAQDYYEQGGRGIGGLYITRE